MARDEFGVLAAFVAVAEDRSFTRAAKRLGVSPSALSHAIRGLEERMGVRLLARTTRSVAPTEAGEQLFTRVRPAFGDVREALDQVSGLRDRPAGRVRLLLPRSAAMIALVPKLGQLARDFPEVVLPHRELDPVAPRSGPFEGVRPQGPGSPRPGLRPSRLLDSLDSPPEKPPPETRDLVRVPLDDEG